jgi:hypothetical protein
MQNLITSYGKVILRILPNNFRPRVYRNGVPKDLGAFTRGAK